MTSSWLHHEEIIPGILVNASILNAGRTSVSSETVSKISSDSGEERLFFRVEVID
jgi:hypothetical protein